MSRKQRFVRRTAVLCAAGVAAGLLIAAAPAGAADRSTVRTSGGHVSGRQVSGRVELLAADPAPGSTSSATVSGLLHVGGRVVPLPAAVAARLRPGERITANASGSGIDTDTIRPIASRAVVPTTGTDKVYVIRAYWTKPDRTTTKQVARHFAKAAAWFTQVSYGQFTITSTVGSGWRKVAAPASCNDAPMSALVSRAERAERAANPAFRPSAYQHIAVYFPIWSKCAWAGLGDIDGKRVWLNGNGGYYTTLDPQITTHELGHNLGLYHSHSLRCFDGTTPVTISDTCAAPVEYGDVSDVMGSSDDFFDASGHYVAAEYTAAQKAQLGWLGSGLRAVAPCRTVQLSPYEGGQNTIAATVVGTDPATQTKETYWLEWRQPNGVGVDAGLPRGLTDGALLHMTTARATTRDPDPGPDLLDAKPSTVKLSDAAIVAGAPVTTPEGYTISVDPVASPGTAAETLPVSVATALPTAPRSVDPTAGSGAVTLSWQTPTCGGSSTVRRYVVQSSRAGGAWTSAGAFPSSPATVTGLVAGSPYRFRVLAVNQAGRGPWSAPTASVTPNK